MDASATHRRARPRRRRHRPRAEDPAADPERQAARSSRDRCGSGPACPASAGRPCRCRDRAMVIMQRPTCPPNATAASPIRTARPTQPSSACASTPSISISIRKRRGSTESIAAEPPPAGPATRARSVTPRPSGPRSTAVPRPSASTSRSERPTKSLSASDHGPSPAALVAACEKKFVVIVSPYAAPRPRRPGRPGARAEAVSSASE